MKRYPAPRTLRTFLSVLACFLFSAMATHAQAAHPASAIHHMHAPVKAAVPTTVAALLVSDVHFEPFWDPEKVALLEAAPASQWNSIFAAAPSPNRAQRFEVLQQNCHTRGEDTSYPLLQSSLQAMRGPAAAIRFVTVSGDLISHAFECKYRALYPRATAGAYRSFVEKTISFVITQLNEITPGIPVYVALGNNDSDCGDYRLDTHSEFLTTTGTQITQAVPASQRDLALRTFADGGYYSVPLPAPIRNARLLVLNDIFMSARYTACSGKPSPTAGDDQLAWLQQQLNQARTLNQKVWVMGHIPPGIDAHGSMARMLSPCGPASPKMYLSSEKIADVLIANSDVVQLALFAHNHMDEIKLLQDGPNAVALKTVPSISPVDGNNPAFTLAQVDPDTATLVDYRVLAADDQTGAGTWTEEYDYALAYREPSYSAASVSQLLSRFTQDSTAATDASKTYLRSYFVGGKASVLAPYWPQYVCTLTHDSLAGFGACACPTAH